MATFVDAATALILVALLLGTLWRPAIAYAAVTAVFALEQWAQGSGRFFAVNGQVMNYSVGGIVLVALLLTLVQGKNPFRSMGSEYYAVAALLGYAVLSGFWSIDPSQTYHVLWFCGPYIVVNCFVMPLLFNEERDFRIALYASIGLAIFLVPALILGTTIHEYGREIVASVDVVNRYGQAAGSLTPLAIAGYAGFVGLILLTARLGRTSNFIRYTGWAWIAMSIYLILRSESRGQFAAVIIVGMLVVRLSYPGKQLTGSMRTALAVVVFAGLSMAMFRIFYSTASEGHLNRWSVAMLTKDYSSTRFFMCGQLMEAWITSSPLNLLFGLGSAASWKIIGVYPHVLAVELLGELGFVGFGIFVAFCAMGFRSARLALRLTKNDVARRGIAVAFISLGLLWFILSFKQGTFAEAYSLYFDVILLGRYAQVLQREKKAEEMRTRQAWMRSNGSQPPVLQLQPSGA